MHRLYCFFMFSLFDLVGSREVKKSLVEKESLVCGSNEGNHGKSAVDNLLLISLGLASLVKLVKSSTSPSNISRPAVSVESLIPVDQFNNADCQQNLNVRAESGAANGLPRVLGGISGPREVREVLLPDHTGHGEHANTSVLEFGPASVTQVRLNIAQAHGVEAHVSGHGPIELLRGEKERDRLANLRRQRRRSTSLHRRSERSSGADRG
mmetsp:Transcript_34925/g.78703  ORF Transcript_34925/g.78703 Transcript_34925/m.78703 type:complete len:210 (+) Transcript_34925:330-959(+)